MSDVYYYYPKRLISSNSIFQKLYYLSIYKQFNYKSLIMITLKYILQRPYEYKLDMIAEASFSTLNIT